MKKLAVLLAVISLGFIACNKDDDNSPAPVSGGGGTSFEVEKKNIAAVIYFGEDWCPPCGAYGGPTVDSCLKDEGTLFTALKINSSSNISSLNWSAGGSMYSQYNSTVFNNASTIPAMAINNIKQGITTSVSSNASGAKAKATAFQADSVVAGIALQKKVEGDSMIVDTKVKFFKAIPAGSDYRLAIYVVEDNVVAAQQVSGSGTISSYVHRNQVRTANASAYTGVSVNSSAAITLDQQFTGTYKMYLKPAWNKANLKVVGILWKMGGSPATVVNSNVLK